MNSNVRLSWEDLKGMFRCLEETLAASANVHRDSFCNVLLTATNTQYTHGHETDGLGLMGNIHAGNLQTKRSLIVHVERFGLKALDDREEAESTRKTKTRCERLSSSYQ